jgi:hypothetical protein
MTTSTGSFFCRARMEARLSGVLLRSPVLEEAERWIASTLPEQLARLNFIFFDDAARFEQAADQLTEALTTDIGWIRCLVFDTAKYDRSKALVERGRERDFFHRDRFRPYRIWAEDEYDRIGPRYQLLDALPPLLEGIDIVSVNERLKTALLERRIETIGKIEVFARVGDEDFGFGFVPLLLDSVGYHVIHSPPLSSCSFGVCLGTPRRLGALQKNQHRLGWCDAHSTSEMGHFRPSWPGLHARSGLLCLQ